MNNGGTMGAKIFDIKTLDFTSIKREEVFAIDTNVLVWTHYSEASNPCLNRHPYQVIQYPDFVAKLLENGNKLVTTLLNLTELCGVIERNRYRIYKAVNGNHFLKFKKYRSDPAEREGYQHEIKQMLMEIRESYDGQIEIINFSEEQLDFFVDDICNNECDIFDYLIIDYLKGKGIHNYISDDKDFSTVDGINLYTAYEEQEIGS